MFVWDYKSFVGNDPNLRKAAKTDIPAHNGAPCQKLGATPFLRPTKSALSAAQQL
jgi:hypothetical protein